MRKLQYEFQLLLTAIMFFTRLPVPKSLPYNNDMMQQSQKYYAWVGILVGVINAAIFFISNVFFGDAIAIVIMMIGSVLLTGAFHEDGFTDMCDAFGGGYGKEKIMHIMKDSRIGAYGTIGIVLLLLLKFVSLWEISQLVDIQYFIIIIIFAHSLSRFVSGTTIYTHRYVQDIDQSKVKPMASSALHPSKLWIGFIAVIIPAVILNEYGILWAIIPAYSTKMWMSYYFKKHIGGYTGDCLGAIQQVTEVIIFLSCIIIWKFIY